MPRSKPFRAIETAPRDGSVIEVRHGPNQDVVRAHWVGQTQAWVREDDPDWKTLHRVIEGRPAEE